MRVTNASGGTENAVGSPSRAARGRPEQVVVTASVGWLAGCRWAGLQLWRWLCRLLMLLLCRERPFILPRLVPYWPVLALLRFESEHGEGERQQHRVTCVVAGRTKGARTGAPFPHARA